jgi:hypothetical protein
MPFRGGCDAGDTGKGLATKEQSGCTSGCTSNPEIGKTLTLEDLAAALVNLSPGDRAKLAALLTDQGKR